MSKWLVITFSAMLVTVGVMTLALSFFIERYKKEAEIADDVFLREKIQMLNDAIDAQIRTGTLQQQSDNIASKVAASIRAVTKEDAKLTAGLAERKKYVDIVQKKYREELAKIK